MEILIILSLIVAGVLIYMAYKYISIHPHKMNYDYYSSRMMSFAKKFGFNEDDKIAKEDIDFRYKHLKALHELYHVPQFYSVAQLDDHYNNMSELSENYEDTRKAFNAIREKFS